MDKLTPNPEPCDRVLVYAATDGSGRTRTTPWISGLPVAQKIDVNGVAFTLVADSRVIDATVVETDYRQMRVRAWNARHFATGEAA